MLRCRPARRFRVRCPRNVRQINHPIHRPIFVRMCGDMRWKFRFSLHPPCHDANPNAGGDRDREPWSSFPQSFRVLHIRRCIRPLPAGGNFRADQSTFKDRPIPPSDADFQLNKTRVIFPFTSADTPHMGPPLGKLRSKTAPRPHFLGRYLLAQSRRPALRVLVSRKGNIFVAGRPSRGIHARRSPQASWPQNSTKWYRRARRGTTLESAPMDRETR